MKQRLLVVEDDPILGKLISDYFEREGWNTVIAADGEIALEKFEEEIFQLILLDVMLPKLDGFLFAKRSEKTAMFPFLSLQRGYWKMMNSLDMHWVRMIILPSHFHFLYYMQKPYR